MHSFGRTVNRAGSSAARACLRQRSNATASAQQSRAAVPMGLFVQQGRFMGGLATKLDEVTAEIPMKEAIRYKKGNLKWTRSDVKKHSEAFSCGLLDLGCKAGDTIAMWLPECSEKHVAQLAAARVGMVVAEVDHDLASADAIANVLEESNATVALVDDAFVPALCEAVPELRHYGTESGLPFRSAKLPSLRWCMHTGIDREQAILNLRSVLLYTPAISPLDNINGQVKESTPLYTNFSAGNGGAPKKGDTLSHADVVRSAAWPTVSAILDKNYVEV